MPKMTVAQKREFLVEMCNCREYLKTDVELNKAVLKKHLKFLPQQKLYKFRACIEREFRMLEENCIWMSLASSFPDPFDHTINIDLVKNRREVKEWLGKNGSSLCFEVVKRLFEEKGLAIPYTFSDFEDYMKTCLDENGIPIKDRERAFLAAHATPDELSQMDSIIQQLVCARKRFASIEEQMTKMLFEIIDQVRRETREKSLIYCMTERYDNHTLWENYAQNYTGFCIEYTATQQPLYSTLPDADDVVAIKGYSNTRMAVRPNQRIIMLNKGIGDKGFTICCDCGAAMPGDDPSVLKDIMRPYRSKFLRTRCKHNETKNVNLGYDFITDMLVLEIALDRQQVSMDLAKNSWLNRAGQSLAEALRLSACQELDIEFTELVTGFRVRQNQKGDFIDIYLYDSLSSGAGYAVSIEASIQQLLIKTRELLSSCNCDSACHKCLKHYRNQYVHGLLDRSAALDLLTWAEKGVRSPMLPVYEQRNLLQSVEQILQFSGVHIDFDHEPIEAESFHGKKRIVVYPAMWARPTEKNMVFVSDSYLKYAKPYALKTIVDGL